MKHITIADIAREAEVSKATVSRVLSKPHLVNENTRKKILSLINKHSFTPNMLAQGLAGMPTRNIGVLVDRFPNNFYIELADGIDSVIAEKNYFFQVMNSLWIPARELQGIRSMIKNHMDGILIAPIAPDSPSVDLLKKSGIPFVLMNCKSDDSDVSYVCTDNYRGGFLMAEHFNALEHEQIIVVSVFDHQSVRERIEGFVDHLNAKTVRIIKYSNAKTYEDGYELASLIAEHDMIRTKKTSLFVANDYVAIGVMTRFLEMGIAIPAQAAVAGFDDSHISALCKVPLTTVSQSVYDMGRIAATELLNIIQKNGSPPFRHIIEPRLVIRESTCPGLG
jgi:DNA-binding LacI/PurR family transcriptional regulator